MGASDNEGKDEDDKDKGHGKEIKGKEGLLVPIGTNEATQDTKMMVRPMKTTGH